MPKLWVVTRNANMRPMLMHRVGDFDVEYTDCGVYVGFRNREFRAKPILVLACKKCAKTS